MDDRTVSLKAENKRQEISEVNEGEMGGVKGGGRGSTRFVIPSQTALLTD